MELKDKNTNNKELNKTNLFTTYKNLKLEKDRLLEELRSVPYPDKEDTLQSIIDPIFHIGEKYPDYLRISDKISANRYYRSVIAFYYMDLVMREEP